MKNAIFCKGTKTTTDLGREEFPVADGMEWVQVPDDANESWITVTNEDGSFKTLRAPDINNDPQLFAEYGRRRQTAYLDPGDQLDMIYHHLANGGVMGDEADEWTTHINNVKAMYPKDDPQMCHDNAKLAALDKLAVELAYATSVNDEEAISRLTSLIAMGGGPNLY
jgi:hypothetical protein